MGLFVRYGELVTTYSFCAWAGVRGLSGLKPPAIEFFEGCRTHFLAGNTAVADQLSPGASHRVSVVSEGALLPEVRQGGHAAVKRTQIPSLCQT